MYLNDKAAAVFMHHITEMAREELVESVQLSPFISLICDGSTDSAVFEQEMVYVRYVDSHGHIIVRVLACNLKANGETKCTHHYDSDV